MLKILFGDLRHGTIGYHSATMPLAVSFLATYTESFLKNKVKTKIFIEPEKLISSIQKDKPDVIALSNYVWNCDLGKYIFEDSEELNHNVISIAGGPEFPRDEIEGADYLRKEMRLTFMFIKKVK